MWRGKRPAYDYFGDINCRLESERLSTAEADPEITCIVLVLVLVVLLGTDLRYTGGASISESIGGDLWNTLSIG
jgi:hypothetical protein